MKRKIFLLIIMVALCVTMFVGCGEDPSSSFVVAPVRDKTNEEKTTDKETKKIQGWNLEWEVPEDFSTTDGMIYVTDKYPEDASYIAYMNGGDDPYGIYYTKESYSKAFSKLMKEIYGVNVDVNISRFENITHSGQEGIYVVLDYEVKGVKISAISYAFEIDGKYYEIGYNDIGEKGWNDIFEKSAKTVKLVPVY